MVERDDSMVDAPASEEEVKAAEELRVALEQGRSTEDADLLRALALAHEPRTLDTAENERLVTIALDRPAKKNNVIKVTFGVSVVVAVAATMLMYLSAQGPTAKPVARAELVPVRSTQSLFDKPFESKSSASARIDRIALAREGDLRENRFARWGVR